MNIKQFTPGVELWGYFSDMPESVYHNTAGFTSKSRLYELATSTPFKFFNSKGKAPTKPMQMGTALHAAVLEPERFKTDFVLLPDTKDRRQAEYKKAKKSHGEGSVFVAGEVANLNGMINAVKGNVKARELLNLDGWCEVSGFHIDEETGIGLRHRFDKLSLCGVAVDLKKTQSVKHDELERTIYKFGYHYQAALYTDAYKAITGCELERFYFVFVEEQFPHEVAVVFLDDVSIQIGREAYRESLREYKHLVESGYIPANNSGEEVVSLPEWVMREYENSLDLTGEV
ncbi:MAG: hypothetical protein GY776_19880 [Alteromonas sp.]|nr:hypothetical protein [Alteromonas sp.]